MVVIVGLAALLAISAIVLVGCILTDKDDD